MTDLSSQCELQERLDRAEQERDQARASTQSLRELVGQWIWAMYLTPESYECRTIETYRQAVEARVRQLEEMVQAELPPPIRRLEQQELLRLRARVGRLRCIIEKVWRWAQSHPRKATWVQSLREEIQQALQEA